MDSISVASVTKTYRIGVGRARVREMLPRPFDAAARRAFPRWWKRDTFDALSDVSLDVPAGSGFGLVGHNGAGKTTLLKVIAGVTAPSRGRIALNGRVAALIDVLVGFHPDLTGRENVPLLGAMHGIGRRTMAKRLADVLDFAEITDLADTPLKRFSAGMAGRLGFATITQLDAEILLIDEVLAVGDATFQRKCITWLDEYRRRGGTLVFVSHNLSLVRNMTDQVVWLDHGKVVEQGATASVLGRYAAAMERRDQGPPMRKRDARKSIAATGQHRWGAGGARVEEVHIGEVDRDALDVRISYEASDLAKAFFCVGFLDEAGQDVGAATSPAVELAGTGRISCSISPVPLRPGIYFPVVAIVAADGTVHDRWRLDRGLVIDQDGGPALGEEFGRISIGSRWDGGSNGATPTATHEGRPLQPNDGNQKEP